MFELTISKEGGGEEILGVINQIIKYRKNGEGPINSNPFNEERIVCYTTDSKGKGDITTTPLVDLYPIIIKRDHEGLMRGSSHEGQYTPGKITEIKKVEQT